MSEFPNKKGNWTELDRTLKYENPWIKVTESKILNPNGGEGIYGVVDFKNFAIGVIPIDEEGNTWIVGQERFPFEGKYTWEIIEGGGPKDVDPIESAERELLEEAGIKAQDWQLIQEMDLSNSATTETAVIYVARDLSFFEAQPEETEELKIQKLPFVELYKMVVSGEIMDSLTVVAVFKLMDMMRTGQFTI